MSTTTTSDNSSSSSTSTIMTVMELGNASTGCLVSREYCSLAKGGIESIIKTFQTDCASPDIINFMKNSGFESPSFVINDKLKPGNPGYDKFLQGLQGLRKHHAAATLGVAFHGTAQVNVRNILRHGLDPSKRSGQAYGPGEYFAKIPGISVSFCKGGKEMLVFVVVLPSSLPDNVKKEKKNEEGSSTFGTASNQSYVANVPPDYVVVNNNHHQLPIGTMRFASVDNTVMANSQARREKFIRLSQELFNMSQEAKEAQLKARIMSLLIEGKVDHASEVYERQSSILKETSKAEISWYVHLKLDADVVCAYFSDLPDPMDWKELEEGKIASVDEIARLESLAKRNLEAERKALLALK